MRGTRAGSRRQGHARAFFQVSGFMAQRGEPIRILARPCSRPDAAVAAVAAHARAQHARLALAPERRAHGYDGGAARGGMIQHVGSAPLGLGLNVQAAPLNDFAAAESVKRVSARGSRHRIAPSSAATLGQAPMAERPVVLPPESVKERAMPITPYLNGMSFHPETKRVMGVAFEMVCTALRLSDRGDLANEMIARRIIELAKAGEHNPDLLCENVLNEFRAQLS